MPAQVFIDRKNELDHLKATTFNFSLYPTPRASAKSSK